MGANALPGITGKLLIMRPLPVFLENYQFWSHVFTFLISNENDFARSHLLPKYQILRFWLAIFQKQYVLNDLGFDFSSIDHFFAEIQFFRRRVSRIELAPVIPNFRAFLEKEALPYSHFAAFFRRLKDFCLCFSSAYQVHPQYPDPVPVLVKSCFFVNRWFFIHFIRLQELKCLFRKQT